MQFAPIADPTHAVEEMSRQRLLALLQAEGAKGIEVAYHRKGQGIEYAFNPSAELTANPPEMAHQMLLAGMAVGRLDAHPHKPFSMKLENGGLFAPSAEILDLFLASAIGPQHGR